MRQISIIRSNKSEALVSLEKDRKECLWHVAIIWFEGEIGEKKPPGRKTANNCSRAFARTNEQTIERTKSSSSSSSSSCVTSRTRGYTQCADFFINRHVASPFPGAHCAAYQLASRRTSQVASRVLFRFFCLVPLFFVASPLFFLLFVFAFLFRQSDSPIENTHPGHSYWRLAHAKNWQDTAGRKEVSQSIPL